MTAAPTRVYLRRRLEAHLTELGYSSSRSGRKSPVVPEIVRVNPVRGSIVYGETVMQPDLSRTRCHERLLYFSQRRTRHRSSILFFIGVAESDQEKLEELLVELAIRSGIRGGHVHVVSIPAPETPKRAKRPRAPA